LKKPDREGIIPRPCTDEETEVGMKVVAIMQTVVEELDDSGKRAWEKMLGLSERIRPAEDIDSNNCEKSE
jgi:hypothetical protein